MSALTENPRAFGFLLSEAPGGLSRENVTIKSGEDLQAGAVLGKITATGKYVAYDSNAIDGSQTAVAVLGAACDASDADTAAAVIARLAPVMSSALVYKDTSPAVDTAGAVVDLAAVFIIARS